MNPPGLETGCSVQNNERSQFLVIIYGIFAIMP
jgi:hypothetical protein